MRPIRTLAFLVPLALWLGACGISDRRTTLYAAVDDAYTAIGNTALSVSAADGLIANDGGGQVDSWDLNTTAGGRVVVAQDGSFLYVPPVGFTGTDTFDYDNAGPATVSIDVADMIWYVDNTAAPGGTGSEALPFSTLTAFNALNGMGAATDPAIGDTIYVRSGNGLDYDGGIVLLEGQQLVGAGVELVVGAQVLQPAGTRPVITNTAGSGIGVELGSGSSVRGLDVEGTADAGIFGSAVAGPVVLNDIAIRNTGAPAISLMDCSGTITIGDAAAPDLLIDAAGMDGIAATGGYPDLHCLGVEVLNADGGIVVNDVQLTATGCFLGTDAGGSVGAVNFGVIADSHGASPMTAVLTDLTVRNGTDNGVDSIAAGTAPLTLALDDCDIEVDGQGLHTEDGATADQLRLRITDVSFTAGVGSWAVSCVGGALDSTYVIRFSDNTAVPDAGGGGCRFDRVTFDADPSTPAVEQVDGGVTLIGTDAMNRVAGDGLRLDDPTGDWRIATLTVYNAGGTGLHVDTKGQATVFNLDVAGGAINTTGGPALFLDPPAHMPPLTVDMRLDRLAGPADHAEGILIDNVRGRLHVAATAPTGVIVRNAAALDLRLTPASDADLERRLPDAGR